MKKILSTALLVCAFSLQSQTTTCQPTPLTCPNPQLHQVGFDSVRNMSTSWPSVYGNWYSNEKYQVLYTVSDLLAMGVSPGKISSIAFDVDSIPGGMNTTFLNYRIKMGCTQTNNFSNSWGGAFISDTAYTVWGPQNYTISTGWNTHTFSQSYIWDGVSNIFIEICYDWVTSGVGYTYCAIMNNTNTNYYSYVVFNSDVTVACPESNFNQSYMSRPNTIFGVCEGMAFLAYNDLDQDCIQDAGEYGIQGVNMLITPGNIIGTTNQFGGMYLDSLPNGNYAITIDTTNLNWATNCPVTHSFTVLNNSLVSPVSFGLYSTNPCTDPDISIFAPSLTRCFSNQLIYVSASNSNTATGVLSNAYVDVELDTLLTVDNASLPYTALGNNIFRFQLSPINPGQSQLFNISTTVSCSASISQTLCIDAFLFPIQSCALDSLPTPPYPGGSTTCTLPWDHSSLSVNGTCQNDTVCFTITNTGQPGNGDMQCYSPVRVYVDGVLTYTDSIQLTGGQTVNYCYPANGETWILQADQHPLHPGNSHPNAHIEGCGDSTNFTTGFVNQFPLDDADPFTDIYCATVSGSYDPNDKTGFPLGTGATHDILPNQQLQYVIRFQNTGTDTAFKVVIRDTLSDDLNIFSVNSGVSSHNYSFKMYGPRVLEWTFDNINLPDSAASEPNSHGFVTFTVEQVPNLPIGTQITNSAGIYFDFNAPVITNVSLHTISLSSLPVGTKFTPYHENNFVLVYPNPFSGSTTFQANAAGNYNFILMDLTGKIISRDKFTGSKYEFHNSGISAGVYIYEIRNENGNVSRGKLIKE